MTHALSQWVPQPQLLVVVVQLVVVVLLQLVGHRRLRCIRELGVRLGQHHLILKVSRLQ